MSATRSGLIVATICLVATVTIASEQIIVLDEAHAMHTGNQSALPYRMAPAEVLVIDASKYDVTSPPGVGPANAIHIKVGPAGYYRVPLMDGARVHRIDGQSVQPLEGSKPLEGFGSGQRVMFAIVHDNYDSMKDDELQFAVIWAGMIGVK